MSSDPNTAASTPHGEQDDSRLYARPSPMAADPNTAVERVARAIWEARQDRSWSRVFSACNVEQLGRAKTNRANMDGWERWLSGWAKLHPQDLDDLMGDARAAIAAYREQRHD